MTVADDINTFAKSSNASGHKSRRKQRQKKKLKKARKRGDSTAVAKYQGKMKQTDKKKRKADKNQRRAGVEIGKRGVKAGASVATGNPVGAVVEFV